MRRPVSIRRIGLLYAAVTGIIIIVAATAVFVEVRNAMRSQQHETLFRALDGKTQILIQSLKVYERAAARIAADPEISARLAVEDKRALMVRANRARANLPDVTRLGFFTTRGEYLGDATNPVSAQCRANFRRHALGTTLAFPAHREDPDGSGHFDVYAPVNNASGIPVGYVFLAVRLSVLDDLLRAVRASGESLELRDASGALLASAGDPAEFNRPLQATLPVAGTGWTMQLNQKRPALTELKSAFAIGTTLTALACAGLAVALTFLGTRQLQQELDRVHIVMRRVAEGEPPYFGTGARFAELQVIMNATEDIAGRIHAHQQALMELSLTDELTGLPNRRHYMQELGRGTNFARRGMPVCVGMLDLDLFKEVNDRAGHDAGDEVLKLVARVLNQNLRAADFAARIGGDEFAIVLLGMSHADARDWFERIRVAFHREYDAAGISTVACSLSGGFAFVDAATDDVNSVLARADAALYEAKREGRDRVIEKLVS